MGGPLRKSPWGWPKEEGKGGICDQHGEQQAVRTKRLKIFQEFMRDSSFDRALTAVMQRAFR